MWSPENKQFFVAYFDSTEDEIKDESSYVSWHVTGEVSNTKVGGSKMIDLYDRPNKVDWRFRSLKSC